MEMHNAPPICWICGNSVSLKECKIDQHELAVQENACRKDEAT